MCEGYFIRIHDTKLKFHVKVWNKHVYQKVSYKHNKGLPDALTAISQFKWITQLYVERTER